MLSNLLVLGLINGFSTWETTETLGLLSVDKYAIQTTDATQTALATIPIPLNTICLITVRVLGVRTGGTSGNGGDSAAYIGEYRVSNKAGVLHLSEIGTSSSKDVNQWECVADISDSNFIINVQGRDGTIIDWVASIFQTRKSYT